MKLLLAVIPIILISGCSKGEWELDQELRHKYFIECLQNAPEGPTRVKYNDWGAVINACDQASLYQAKRFVLDK